MTDAPLMRLLVWCADGPGIVSAVSSFLYEAGANIVQSDQHSSDPEGGEFYLRMEFTMPNATDSLPERFAAQVADRFDVGYRFLDTGDRKRIALVGSRDAHVL